MGALLYTILIAVTAAGLLSAAVLLFAATLIVWWLWRTPLAVKGRAAAGLTRVPEGYAHVTFDPFIADVTRRPDGLYLRLRFREREIWSQALADLGGGEPEPEKKPGNALKLLRTLNRYWGIQEVALHLVKCLRFFSIEEFSGYVEFGSDDPAQTGEIYGYLCAATPLWEKLPEFSFRPNWSPRGAFEFDLTVSVGFYVFQLVCSTLWFAVSRFRWRELFPRGDGQKPVKPVTSLPEARRHAA